MPRKRRPPLPGEPTFTCTICGEQVAKSKIGSVRKSQCRRCYYQQREMRMRLSKATITDHQTIQTLRHLLVAAFEKGDMETVADCNVALRRMIKDLR